MIWIAIAVGGALGSMARHGVNVLVHGRWPMTRFPLATFVVNVIGCLVIGVLAGLIMSGRITPRLYWREFVFDLWSRHGHSCAHAVDDAGRLERHRSGRARAAGRPSRHLSK
jgi:hypothetical protein